MQNLILRANIPYADPDDPEKKHSSGPLSYSREKMEQWYPHSLLFAALLTLLASWIFYMTPSVFGWKLLDFRNDNLTDMGIILLIFILLWFIFSIVGFLLTLSSKQKKDEAMTSLPNIQADITAEPRKWYFLAASFLCIILMLLDLIKKHPLQPIALEMVAILAVVRLWPYFRPRILALPKTRLLLQRLILPRRIGQAKGIETSFAILTKYYPSSKRKNI